MNLQARNVLFALLGLLQLGLSHALDAGLSLSQLHHTAWTARDGAPADIAAIAQTRDGHLWLATPGGLFKFDGLRFERLDLFPGEPQRSQHVFGLRGLPDGSLWIGYRRGGGSVLRGRTLTHYLAKTDLGKSSIYGFDQDKDGVVWAGGSAGLYRLHRDGQGEHWQLVGKDQGYAEAYLSDWRMDPQGGLWAKGQSRWYTLVRGGTRFQARDDVGDTQDIAFAPDGALWRWAQGGDIGPQDRAGQGVRWSPPFNAGALLFDRQGSLWVSSYGHGLQRMARPLVPGSQAERFTQKDGLSGNNIKSAFEDREGNLWFGSTQGLDRFRNPRAVLAPFPGGPDGGPIAAGEQGEVWAAGFNKVPVRLTPGGQFKAVAGDYDEGQRMFVSAYRDTDGSLWFGSTPLLWHLEQGRMQRVAAPAKVPALQAVQALTRDRAGVLWVSFGTAGLFGLKDGHWREPDPRWPRGQVSSLLTDAHGVLWLGYADNRIVRIEGATVQSLGEGEGLELGYVAALYSRDGQLWAGGNAGLALLAQGRFSAVLRDDGEPLRSVTGIIGTTAGALWLNDENGIIHIAPGELSQRLAQPAHRLHIDLLDRRDGVLGSAVTPRPLPSVVQASDGRLWFTRSTAIYWVDPQPAAPPYPHAPALITALSIGERRLAPEPGLQLPIGTRQLRIDYTALNLGTPERTRFRYKLEGVDEDWQQAGTRRDAAYTNLGPGQYRFVVHAAFGNAPWVETGDSLAFSVLPAFHQTKAFMALCLLALTALAWAIHRWRLALDCRRVQERIEARLAERERIARELHDTLLQSTAGLMLEFQAALDDMPADQAARQSIASALDKADGVLIEGRERVLDLRSHQQDVELSQALLDQASATSPPGAPALSRQLRGRPRPLCAAIWAEAYRIGQEAIINAQRHAHATSITIEMDYAASGVTLRVRDDGIGITPELLAAGARPGHWGLVGMRERAVQMEAQLQVSSTPGAGTEVLLRMGNVAYLPELGRSLIGHWWRRWRLKDG